MTEPNPWPPAQAASGEDAPVAAASGRPQEVGAPFVPQRKPQIPLPVVPTTYPLFWRAPLWQVWRPIVGLIVGGVVAFVAMGMFPAVSMFIDLATGRLTPEDLAGLQRGDVHVTPMLFLFNNLGIALTIPVAMLVAWLFFKQRPGWLASVTGRFRWRWFGLVCLVILPLYLIGTSVVLGVSWSSLNLAWNRDSLFLIFSILLTTPLQCAGEEFLDRGMINRAVASFWRNPVGGPLLGGLVSTLVFVAMHAATDPVLNIFYFMFGAIACWLAWRTGGLEAPIALHLVNNVSALATIPFSDISGMFERSAGATQMGATDIISSLGMPILAVVAIEILYRRKPQQRTSAPGLATLPNPPAAWRVYD